MRFIVVLFLLVVATQEPIFDEGIALLSGEKWMLSQGYSIEVKGVDFEGENIWLSLYQDNTTLYDGVVPKGTVLCVYHTKEKFSVVENGNEEGAVLVITVYGIYEGATQDLVLFFVKQYKDALLPMTPPEQKPSQPSQKSEEMVPSPNYGLTDLLFVLFMLVLLPLLTLFFKRRFK